MSKSGANQKSLIPIPIICLAVGVILVAFPDFVYRGLGYLIGILFLLLGAYFIIPYLKQARWDNWPITIPAAIFTTIGLVFVLHPYSLMRTVWVFFGVFLIIDSAIKLLSALEMRKADLNGFKVNLIIAVITVTLGSILVFTPFIDRTMIIISGAFLIANALFDIIALISYNRFKKKYLNGEGSSSRQKKDNNTVSEQDF